MSEFTWYSRLAVWIGCAMLLAQSVVGRDAGPVSVLAVLLLVVGLICFLAGLVTDARERKDMSAGVSAPRAEDEPTPEPTVAVPEQEQQIPSPSPAAAQTRRPKFRERTSRSKAAGPANTVEDASRSTGSPVQNDSAPAVREPREAASTTLHVQTRMLDAASPALADVCPRCGQALAVGQLSATCPVCGGVHHAVCWMEHDFHCSTPACTGEGSLEAAR